MASTGFWKRNFKKEFRKGEDRRVLAIAFSNTDCNLFFASKSNVLFQALHQELSYASHLGVPAILVKLSGSTLFNFARFLNHHMSGIHVHQVKYYWATRLANCDYRNPSSSSRFTASYFSIGFKYRWLHPLTKSSASTLAKLKKKQVLVTRKREKTRGNGEAGAAAFQQAYGSVLRLQVEQLESVVRWKQAPWSCDRADGWSAFGREYGALVRRTDQGLRRPHFHLPHQPQGLPCFVAFAPGSRAASVSRKLIFSCKP